MSIFNDDLIETPVGVCAAYELCGSSYVSPETDQAIKTNFSKKTIYKILSNSNISKTQKEDIKKMLMEFQEKNKLTSVEYMGLICVLMTADHLGEKYLSDLFTKCLKSKWKNNKVSVTVKNKNNISTVELNVNTYLSQRFYFILMKKF